MMEAAGTNRRKGLYNTYTHEQRAIIGKHALENGVMAAKRKFSKKLQMDINESTVRCFKETYLKKRSRKRQVEDDDVSVNELPVKKRGRKVVLWTNNGQHGSAVHFKTEGNTKCDKYSCCNFWCILQSQDQTRLGEFNGPATLTTAWAKSL